MIFFIWSQKKTTSHENIVCNVEKENAQNSEWQRGRYFHLIDLSPVLAAQTKGSEGNFSMSRVKVRRDGLPCVNTWPRGSNGYDKTHQTKSRILGITEWMSIIHISIFWPVKFQKCWNMHTFSTVLYLVEIGLVAVDGHSNNRERNDL